MSLTVKPFLQPNEVRPLTRDDVTSYCGKALGMCYEQDNFDQIMNEPAEVSTKRAMGCIKSGHHSGFEHAKYTFVIEGLPKMLAMVLNNQRKYATSEKSGRYTVLDVKDEVEIALRKKWQDRFYEILHAKYYDDFYKFYTRPTRTSEKTKELAETAIKKKAQENSRLITSVFAPTKMLYSVDIRQLSYLRFEMKKFFEEAPGTPYYETLKEWMQEFIDETETYGMEEVGLNPAAKGVRLPLFAEPSEEEYGVNYSMTDMVTFATYAQNQRHRTVKCTMQIPETPIYFVPEFIKDNPEYVEEWLADMKSRTTDSDFPQGMMVIMNEKGDYQDFIQKTYERLCGQAQWEIMSVTKAQLERYLANTTSPEVKAALQKINCGARCMYGFKCTNPCVFGAKNALTREF